jgi:TolB-like protein/DNA-binding winged helix-turn-helix (wHTH) protein/Flp pilus assembly protein TadD
VSQNTGSDASPSAVRRFGPFEVDLRTRELKRNGIKVKLQYQPFQILQMLLDRAGEVVTREEIRGRIWPADTFVDFDHSVNTAVKKLRQALGDRAENPLFIETLPRQGFRFIAAVGEPAKTVVDTGTVATSAPEQLPPRRVPRLFAAGAAALGVLACTLFLVPRVIKFRTQGLSRSLAASAIRSIAVLPLVNASSDPNQEYFSNGMTSELITDLARFSKLRVISHTSVNRYKETKHLLPEIARELGVDAIVEGTVVRSGDRVRITAQLIDARTDRHLWADSYERDFRDILSLEAEVAQQIATEVGIHLTASEQARLASNRVVDPAAHEAYLKGAFHWRRLTCAGYSKAVEYFQESIAKDPTFAAAYSGAADAHFSLADWGCMPQEQAFPKSKAAALKAVELDPGSAQGHAILGDLAFYREWDWPKAEKEYKQAIDLDANDADIHAAYAVFLTATNRQEQGLREMTQAQAADPVSELTNVMSAYLFYLDHQYNEAIAQAKKTLELYPRSGSAYYWLGQSYEKKGMDKQAVSAYLSPPPPSDAKLEKIESWRDRNQQSLRGFWQKQLEKKAGNQPVAACWQTQIYAHLGNKERTFQLLEWGFQHHCDGLQFLKVEPIYDNLRNDHRYKTLLSRLGL